jgi:hypothetical protein
MKGDPQEQNWGQAGSFAKAAKFEPVPILQSVLITGDICAALSSMPADNKRGSTWITKDVRYQRTLLKNPITALLIGGAALSVWVGVQLLGRDWLAWAFLVVVPLLCLVLLWLRSHPRKDGGGKNEP